MSSLPSDGNEPDFVPLIALVHRLNRALQDDMTQQARQRGYAELSTAHNAVFATLGTEPARATDMAARAGITRQSMGELVRGMCEIGYLEMRPDPTDRRAKLVAWSEKGLQNAREGFEHIRARERQFAEEFGPREYDALKDQLARITRLVEDSA